MVKDTGMMGRTCNCQHHKIFGWVVLLAGVLYLLSDLGWVGWWNVNWWTVAFVLVGLGTMCSCCGRGKCF
ncbi:MAG: hypothetical protein AABW45_03300 [Nanoarchaeota archaeon]